MASKDKNGDRNTRMVSVWITTYNHEAFIGEAIESVLMQQTNFDFEIIIGEDYSTDKTREIVLEYKKRYPDRIRLFLPERNLGMMPMAKASFEFCTGKYVALLDGDDFWTDPLKLQKQVNFLESHPAFTFCFHKVSELNQTDKSMAFGNDPSGMEENDTLVLDHFLQPDCPAYALSVVFRNSFRGKLPDWYARVPWGDLVLYCMLLRDGKAKYLRDNMGCYRVHESGAYSGESTYSNALKAIELFEVLKKELDYLDKKTINQTIARYYLRLFSADCREFRLLTALYHLLAMIRYDHHLALKYKRSCGSRLIKTALRVPFRIYLGATSSVSKG